MSQDLKQVTVFYYRKPKQGRSLGWENGGLLFHIGLLRLFRRKFDTNLDPGDTEYKVMALVGVGLMSRKQGCLYGWGRTHRGS